MPVGLSNADLTLMGKPIFHLLPLTCPFTEFLLFDQLSYKITLGEHIKGLAEIKMYNIHCFLLVHRAIYLNREENQVLCP